MFFCDLYDEAANKISPEMIPYTQVLYYKDPTKGFNADYEQLIVAPFHGISSSRKMTTTMHWVRDDQTMRARNGDAGYRSADAEIKRRNEQVKAAKAFYDRRGYSSLSDNEKWEIANEIAKLRFLPQGIQDLADKILTAKAHSQKDLHAMLFWAVNNTQEEDTPSSIGTQNVAVNTEAIHYTVDAASCFQRLGSADVKLGEDRYPDDGLTITQSLICKNSDKRDAVNCLVKMANVLFRVAPKWYHVALNTQKDKTEYSNVNLVYDTPNQFMTQFRSTLKNGEKKDNWSAFEYQGDFQLRQGYEVYQHLVPKTVTVTMSPDYLRLQDNPFENFNDYKGYQTNTQNTAKAEYSPETILEQWKAGGLYREIPLYSKGDKSKSGYLFPQWVNISISLTRAEPYDGINGVQQMFCFGGTEAIQE